MNDPALEAVLERAAEIVAAKAIDYQARYRSGDRSGALLAQHEADELAHVGLVLDNQQLGHRYRAPAD